MACQIRNTPIPKILATPLLAAALLALSATPVLAWGYCSSYGVMCYRAWTPEERPEFLSRLHAPDGDYMGSIFLAEGNSGFLGTGLGCRPRGEAPGGNWDKACNLHFSECLGKCFAE